MVDPIPVHLAVEDELSETVLRAILDQSGRVYSVGTCFRRRGSGYLRKRIGGFNSAAKHTPFVLLTDLDDAECAPKLVEEWLTRGKHHNLIFRVAIREVEAWVLAHRSAFASFLGISQEKVPETPDELANPKMELIGLAGRSRRTALRKAIVPRPGSKKGPDYNATLSAFIESDWNMNEAAKRSPSLRRACEAIASFEPILTENGAINDRK